MPMILKNHLDAPLEGVPISSRQDSVLSQEESPAPNLKQVKIKRGKRSKSPESKQQIIGNWNTNNYLDMDKGARRKFLPNPCNELRFE